MKVYNDIYLRDFKPWSGAKDMYNYIIEQDKDNEFEEIIEELYPDGLSKTELNDILWFEEDWICEMLDIKNPYKEDEE